MIFFPIIFGLPWEVIWGNLHPSVRRRLASIGCTGRWLIEPLPCYCFHCYNTLLELVILIFNNINTWYWWSICHANLLLLKYYALWSCITYLLILLLLLSLMEHPAIVYYCFCSTLLRFLRIKIQPSLNIWSTLPIVMRVFYHSCCFCHFQYHCDVF